MNRLRASLFAIPGPEAKEEAHRERKHNKTPPTVAGPEIEVTSNVDEPKGVPFPQQRSASPVVSETLRKSLVLLLSCRQTLIDLIVVKCPPSQ